MWAAIFICSWVLFAFVLFVFSCVAAALRVRETIVADAFREIVCLKILFGQTCCVFGVRSDSAYELFIERLQSTWFFTKQFYVCQVTALLLRRRHQYRAFIGREKNHSNRMTDKDVVKAAIRTNLLDIDPDHLLRIRSQSKRLGVPFPVGGIAVVKDGKPYVGLERWVHCCAPFARSVMDHELSHQTQQIVHEILSIQNKQTLGWWFRMRVEMGAHVGSPLVATLFACWMFPVFVAILYSFVTLIL